VEEWRSGDTASLRGNGSSPMSNGGGLSTPAAPGSQGGGELKVSLKNSGPKSSFTRRGAEMAVTTVISTRRAALRWPEWTISHRVV
jgi:hypothetical protein